RLSGQALLHQRGGARGARRHGPSAHGPAALPAGTGARLAGRARAREGFRVEIPTMIVDDQEDVRLLLRVLINMANEGLFVRGEAGGGVEALDRLEEDDPIVIVLDQMMPDMNGLETAAQIRTRRP